MYNSEGTHKYVGDSYNIQLNTFTPLITQKMLIFQYISSSSELFFKEKEYNRKVNKTCYTVHTLFKKWLQLFNLYGPSLLFIDLLPAKSILVLS